MFEASNAWNALVVPRWNQQRTLGHPLFAADRCVSL